MLREGWNFHGDIAISLEGDALHYFGWSNRPFDKIFDADAIESGNFVEAMIILLREKTGFRNDTEDPDIFVKDCASYMGMRGNNIKPEIAQDLYDRFTRLFH